MKPPIIPLQVNDKVALRESHGTNLDELTPSLKCGVLYCVDDILPGFGGWYINLMGLAKPPIRRHWLPSEHFRLVYRGSDNKNKDADARKGGN
jgi:hypothetical protein